MEPLEWRNSTPESGLNLDGYKVPLSVFLFVNDLSEFQRAVIPLFARRIPLKSEVGRAKTAMAHQADLWAKAGFTPEGKRGDMVNTPAHYSRFPLEPTTFIMENGIDWCRGNALKYICRAPFKNGIEDLRKAIRYLSLYEKFRDGDQGWSK